VKPGSEIAFMITGEGIKMVRPIFAALLVVTFSSDILCGKWCGSSTRIFE
jgi:hypothetical protein